MKTVLLAVDDELYAKALKDTLFRLFPSESELKVLVIDNLYSLSIICTENIDAIFMTNSYLEGMDELLSADEFIPLQVKKRADMFAKKLDRTIRMVLRSEFDSHAREFFESPKKMSEMLKNSGIIWVEPNLETMFVIDSIGLFLLQ